MPWDDEIIEQDPPSELCLSDAGTNLNYVIMWIYAYRL